MRATTLIASALTLAVGSACSTMPPAPPPADPVGTFDCLFVVNGEQISGVLTIEEAAEGGYEGTVSSEMGTMPVRRIVVDGPIVSFTVDTPDLSVPFDLTFDGDAFSGHFDAGDMGQGTVTGTRRS